MEFWQFREPLYELVYIILCIMAAEDYYLAAFRRVRSLLGNWAGLFTVDDANLQLAIEKVD